MRQAGRYLPEFQKIRLKNQNFINLCLNSELSSEITLQPIKRFDLDSAIIFSDILLVPHALGQKVEFIKNTGPVLSKFNLKEFLNNDKISFTQKLHPIYKAIEITRKKLNKKKSLIAFVGSPWTLLIYMLGLKEDKNKINSNKIKGKEFEINLIIDKLNEYLCVHIENQVNAGADVVQIFDSWAGLLSPNDLPSYCYIPNLKIVEFCREKKIPTICFPKGIGKNYEEFNKIVKPDGLSLDYDVDARWAKKHLRNVVLQGGLSPNILLQTDKIMFEEAKVLLDIYKGKSLCF
jgi:uroporphyrinogen decarboxylase